jgi:hypothetical protein
MRSNKVFIPSVTATSVMTIFSFVVSTIKHRNFIEPQLLSRFIKNEFKTENQNSLPAALLMHYGIGVAMNVLFNFLWQNFKIKSASEKIIISGSLGSLIAVISWRLIFIKMPPRSRKYYKEFYTQLIVAHFIFAIAVLLAQEKSGK